MFKEFHEKRVASEAAAEAERIRAEQAKQSSIENKRKQAAEAVVAARQESIAVLERFSRVRKMVERVIRQYCEAVLGDSEQFRFDIDERYADLTTNEIIQPYKCEGQRVRSSSELDTRNKLKLLTFLGNKNNWGVDSLILEGLGFFNLRAKHGRLYEVFVKSVVYSVSRTTDFYSQSYDDSSSVVVRYLTISINADAITVSFSSKDFPEVILTAQTEQELVEKITELEKQIQEKLNIS